MVTYTDDGIRVHLTNIGDASMYPPIYVTIYKDSVGTDYIIQLDSIMTVIGVGDTLGFLFTINNLWDSPFERIIVGLNNKAGVFPYQKACDALPMGGAPVPSCPLSGRMFYATVATAAVTLRNYRLLPTAHGGATTPASPP